MIIGRTLEAAGVIKALNHDIVFDSVLRQSFVILELLASEEHPHFTAIKIWLLLYIDLFEFADLVERIYLQLGVFLVVVPDLHID